MTTSVPQNLPPLPFGDQPWPDPVTTVNVQACYGLDCRGTIEFLPCPCTIKVKGEEPGDPDTFLSGPIIVDLANTLDGCFSVPLLAADSDGIDPTGWTYRVTESLTCSDCIRTYYIFISKDLGPVANLGDLACDPAAGNYIPVVGPPGPEGPAGTDGNTPGLYSGSGDPVILHTDGDLYYDQDSGNLWQQQNGEWTLQGNLKGDPGPQGDPGPAGPQGVPGQDGQDGRDGMGQIMTVNGDKGPDVVTPHAVMTRGPDDAPITLTNTTSSWTSVPLTVTKAVSGGAKLQDGHLLLSEPGLWYVFSSLRITPREARENARLNMQTVTYDTDGTLAGRLSTVWGTVDTFSNVPYMVENTTVHQVLSADKPLRVEVLIMYNGNLATAKADVNNADVIAFKAASLPATP